MRFDWFHKKVELRQPVSDLTWDSRMFVVHVIDHLDEDGAEHVLIQLMRAQVESGWRVSVVTLGEPNTLVHDIYGSGILYRGCDRARLDDPRLLLDLVGVLQRLGPDVVHTHLFHADLFRRLAARLAGVAAIVSTAHSTAAWAQSGKRRGAMRWSTRLGHRMVAVSETVQQSAAAQLRLPVPRIDVIPNGIDLEPLARAQARLQMDAAKNPKAAVAADQDGSFVWVVARGRLTNARSGWGPVRARQSRSSAASTPVKKWSCVGRTG